MIQAVLFDLDGTVLDTKESILQSFEYTLQTQGAAPVPREDINVLIGRSLEEIYPLLLPDAEVEVVMAIHRKWQVENAHLYRPFPRSAATLKRLREQGLKIGAVTTRKQTVLLSLQEAGVFDLFDVIVTGDRTARVKPDPESLLTALSELAISPHEAVMVGDTEVDIQAGKSAGTRTIGVTYGFRTRLELEPYEPDYLVDDIAEVPRIIMEIL